MEKKIVFASSNKKKLQEISLLFSKYNVKVIPQTSLDIIDVQEDGLTFVENAILKARNCCLYSGLPSISDDSGLIVDALNGSPGIYSSRYCTSSKIGEDKEIKRDQNNINKLLSKLKSLPRASRKATLFCTLVFMRFWNDPCPGIFEGYLRGSILDYHYEDGDFFGYDPIFYVEKYGETLSKMDITTKNKISHRAQAVEKSRKKIFDFFVEKTYS